MSQYSRIEYQPKMELLPPLLHQTLQAITMKLNISEKDIYVLGFVDMNMPHAKLKERVDQWAVGCQTLTERFEETCVIWANQSEETEITRYLLSPLAGKQHQRA